MLNINKIYTKKRLSNQGFTLLEVLIAMLIATFFVIGSMQALVLATALRVKAQENQRANQLIQEDIELIRFEAEQLAQDNSLCSADAYDTDGTTAPATTQDSYAQRLWETLPNVSGDKQLLDGKGKTYRLARTPATSSGIPTSTAKVLKIDFSVSPLNSSGNLETDSDGNIIVIAEDYIEVIPDVALETCPN